MTPEKWLFSKLKEGGVTMQHVSSASGISYNVVFEASKGRRKLKVDEFCALCEAGRVSPIDYFEQIKEGKANA